jgi:ABC-type Mn2+/Zn2+ transport system ATPase subunit
MVKEAQYAVAKLVAKQEVLRDERARVTKQRLGLLEKLGHLQDAQAEHQQLAEYVQNAVNTYISETVTNCLQIVYGPTVEFKVVFKKKRGKTEGRFVFKKDGRLTDPINADSGGMAQIAAFILRCICIHMTNRRKVIFLDEPFGGVDKKATPQIRELLDSLSTEFGMQIVMVTHNEELHAGSVIHL